MDLCWQSDISVFNTLSRFVIQWMNIKMWLKATYIYGFTGGLVVKNFPANAGDTGLVPWSGRSPGEGNDNPL